MILGCNILYVALAALPTSRAPMPSLPVAFWCTSGLLSLEMLSEGLIHDLGDGQAVQVCLASDSLDPAALDVEGDALGLLGGIAGLGEGVFAGLPPGDDLLKGRYHTDNHVLRGRNLGTLFAGCSHEHVSRARVYIRCTPKCREVYIRCTKVYKGSFAQLLTERTGLLQVIGILELVVFLERCLRRIIQHIRRSAYFASVSKELTDPQGTEQMRVAPFPGPFQDEYREVVMKALGVKRFPRDGQEHIRTGRGIGKAESKDREVFLKVVNDVWEILGQIEAKSIDSALTLADFEFVTSEGQPPMPLCVLIQIAMQLHFTDVALPQGNAKQEPEHEGSAVLTRTINSWALNAEVTRNNSFTRILQFTQSDTFKIIEAEQKIVFVMHRLRGRKRPPIVLECLDLGMFEVDRQRDELIDNQSGMCRVTHADTFFVPGNKGIEAIHAEEIIPDGDWLVRNVVEVAQIVL